MKPTVGRIVHYVSYGTPPRADGSQVYESRCRAAIVTAPPEYLPATFHSRGGDAVGLCVLNPEGMFFNRGVLFDDGAADPGDPACPEAAGHAGGVPQRCGICDWRPAGYVGGTWHWPEREA